MRLIFPGGGVGSGWGGGRGKIKQVGSRVTQTQALYLRSVASGPAS